VRLNRLVVDAGCSCFVLFCFCATVFFLPSVRVPCAVGRRRRGCVHTKRQTNNCLFFSSSFQVHGAVAFCSALTASTGCTIPHPWTDFESSNASKLEECQFRRGGIGKCCGALSESMPLVLESYWLRTKRGVDNRHPAQPKSRRLDLACKSGCC